MIVWNKNIILWITTLIKQKKNIPIIANNCGETRYCFFHLFKVLDLKILEIIGSNLYVISFNQNLSLGMVSWIVKL